MGLVEPGKERVFFCAVVFGSGAVHSTASAARCLPARCYSNRTRPASENNLVLNENLLCANGGKIGGGSGRGEGGKKGRKEGMRRLDLAYLSCTFKAYWRNIQRFIVFLQFFFFSPLYISLKFCLIYLICSVRAHIKMTKKKQIHFLQKSQVSSQSQVINSSHFSSFTSINGIIMQHYVMFLLMSCVCMRGIELFAGWGTMPASTGIPPLYPSPFSLVLFGPSQPVANCPIRKSQSGWTVARERVPTAKINCLSLPGSGCTTLTSAQRTWRHQRTRREVEIGVKGWEFGVSLDQ